MPAKKEYLTTPRQRTLKISAAVLGGYFVSITFHLFLATILPDRNIVMLTATFTLFLLWGILMIVPFLAQNGWKIWGVYLLLICIFSSITFWLR
ncbi:hypothetical protein [Xanthocytophaga flava]|uniref:hypothetical protein n=1 Tax=Xanthocytophaga flava TaxID=3048013 RepID=UPI0028D2418D|nr:hypothetical protein [Xanthocytophaga flavus]MDJ1469310.1 hypothetical protein [Xanthocytophaga flavus]